MRKVSVAALAAAGAATSIILAPLAGAAVAGAPAGSQHIAPAPQSCTSTNAGSECISPGNAQINDSPPFVNTFPMYGAFPWIL
ncbi:hypothetical protein VST63_23000 [Mycolicibacterium sp. 050232]|uniref:hypothetical protein n=1 Tax=Mycolicibacterium sp. 050232 TaxID=3113982 RepID=UPI002E2B6D02|nr:hypothetical protein [Mycolicibacterium sp. 050232]MED5815238.1 hypothetical protein [Mycolicibacterium sp. 050232]